MRGELAIGREEVRRRVGDLAEDGTADLERGRVELLLHAPGSGVSRAALDGDHFGARDSLERLLRLQPDLLHARMARHVVGDLAERARELRLEETVAAPRDEILERVEHRV